MRYYKLVFLCCLTFTTTLLSQVPEEVEMVKTAPFNIKEWNMDNGLPQNSVLDILQTTDGHIWIATYGGLARFNGIEFQLFELSENPNLISNRIAQLFEDSQQNLWIGHENNGISIYSGDSFQTLDSTSQFSELTAMCFAEDDQGAIWIGTTKGLVKFSNGKLNRYDAHRGLKNEHVRRLIEDGNGNIWAVTGITGYTECYIYKISNDSITEMAHYEKGEDVYAITLKSNKEMYLARKGLLESRSTEDFKLINRVRNPAFHKVTNMQVDKESNLWVATLDGLMMIEANQLLQEADSYTPYYFTDALDIATKYIFQDKNGHIWAGTDGNGLVLITKSPVIRYVLPNDFAVKSFSSIAEDGTGGFWITSQCEGLFHYDGEQFYKFFLYDCTSAVTLNNQNQPIVGLNSSLIQIENGKMKRLYDPKTPTNSDIVNALYVDSGDTIWIGTRGSGLFAFHGSKIQKTVDINGPIPDKKINVITASRNGDLLIGSVDGFSRLNGSNIETITKQHGLAAGEIRSIYEDSENVLWVGSYGGGLSRIENAEISTITKKDGLFEDVVSRITEDKNGHLWMMGNFGLFYVSKAQLNAFAKGEISKVNSFSYGSQEGMAEGNGAGGVAMTENGKTWWPTINGVACININQAEIDSTVAPVTIKSVLVGTEQVIQSPRNIALNPKQRDIQVSYVALNFDQPEKVNYKYMLEGYDENWRFSGNRRTLNYTNLAPGEYTLKITASNRNNIWSEEFTALRISVEPSFLETIWAKIIFSIGLALLVIIFFKWRLKYLEDRRKELKLLVQERTRDLESKRDELEKALENLRQTQDQLIQSEKLASIGTLTSGLAHELNNPLSYIGGIVQPLKMDLEEIKKLITKGQGFEKEQSDFVVEEMIELLDNLDKGVKKASTIIKNLMNISPYQDIERAEDIDLAELIKSTISIYQGSNPDIVIQCNVCEGAIIRANAMEINQALANIISNSIEAINGNGKITVDLSNNEQQASLTIADNGSGIAPEHLAQIFEPFFSTKRPGTSTGLGLYISYSIIRKYHGDIEVDSSDQGTTVKVCLPFNT